MRNYLSELGDIERHSDISIDLHPELLNGVRHYQLNRDNNNILVTSWSGETKIVPLSVEKVDELAADQRKQLDTIIASNDTLKKDSQDNFKLFAKLMGILGIANIGFFIYGGVILGSCMALGIVGSVLATLILEDFDCVKVFFKSHKLGDELDLVSWTADHSDQVNEVIKEEVKKETNDKEHMDDSAFYPEEIYENGVSLNNVDCIPVKTLKKIRQTVNMRQR